MEPPVNTLELSSYVFVQIVQKVQVFTTGHPENKAKAMC